MEGYEGNLWVQTLTLGRTGIQDPGTLTVRICGISLENTAIDKTELLKCLISMFFHPKVKIPCREELISPGKISVDIKE